MIPYQIERIVDRAGAVLEEGRPVPRDALRPDTAYIMVSLMRGVVQRGTGARARQLGWPVGGKTGTMDDYTDAWFVGFDPEITLGVWVGYDEKKTLGDGEEGARVAVLGVALSLVARLARRARHRQARHRAPVASIRLSALLALEKSAPRTRPAPYPASRSSAHSPDVPCQPDLGCPTHPR